LASAAAVVIVTSARSLTQLYTLRPHLHTPDGDRRFCFLFFQFAARTAASDSLSLVVVKYELRHEFLNTHAHGNGHLKLNKSGNLVIISFIKTGPQFQFV